GFMTLGVTEDATLNRSMGFARGFHRYRENRLAPGFATPGLARATFRQALHWLRERPPEPYFLFIHTYEVHTPYSPPQSHVRVVSTPERVRARPIDKVVLYEAE